MKLENFSKEEYIILGEIRFYFQKQARTLGITQLKYTENTIYICLSRPGLFIGKKGNDIEAMTQILKKTLNNPHLNIVLEESKIDWKLTVWADPEPLMCKGA